MLPEWGEIIEVNPQIISELSGILVEGELVNKAHINLEDLVNAFYDVNEWQIELQIHKGNTKGVSRENMDEP